MITKGISELKNNIIKTIEEKNRPFIQEFNDAQNKYEGIKKKKSDYTNRLELLKLEIKQPFKDLEDIDETIKNRRCIEKEIEECEEILKNIEQFLTDSQEKMRIVAEKFSGIILSVFREFQDDEQKRINSLLDSVKLITENFNKVLREVPGHFLGNSLHEFSLYQGIITIGRQFDFSRAPDNGSSMDMARHLLQR
jgi:chemotaxis regulatin CheY-phosphate phosphatase CheZ